MMRILASLLLLLTACATATAPAVTAPPWRNDAIARDTVPDVYMTQWEKAENRAACALVAPRSVGAQGEAATPRAATFSGGWAVAYDLPNLRSAFGVAGAGVRAGEPSYSKWPYVQEWGDGSKAEYGPEGGEGPNQLAYVRIHGQDCLYNVWSRLGKDHLELLLREMRFVK
ncbi:MAG TPA: hypothetical protein VEK11_05015 [Thermoanaerobaculia bacterium]|jgi:hypothetical protein|nr:hypothetical protein [Thermoanaerobaculia bacterium]